MIRRFVAESFPIGDGRWQYPKVKVRINVESEVERTDAEWLSIVRDFLLGGNAMCAVAVNRDVEGSWPADLEDADVPKQGSGSPVPTPPT